MKIGPDHILKDTLPPSAHKAEQSRDETFHKILQEAMVESPVTKGTETTGVPPPDKPGMPSRVLSHVDKGKIADRVGRLLDTLEDYQKTLGDREMPLKALHPLVSKLENEREILLSFVDQLPEGDALRTVLNRTLITTTVETMKFLRGDYL